MPSSTTQQGHDQPGARPVMGRSTQQHTQRWQQAALGADAADAQSSGQAPSPSPQQRPIPWNLTFDLRERETLWTDENKVPAQH